MGRPRTTSLREMRTWPLLRPPLKDFVSSARTKSHSTRASSVPRIFAKFAMVISERSTPSTHKIGSSPHHSHNTPQLTVHHQKHSTHTRLRPPPLCLQVDEPCY